MKIQKYKKHKREINLFKIKLLTCHIHSKFPKSKKTKSSSCEVLLLSSLELNKTHLILNIFSLPRHIPQTKHTIIYMKLNFVSNTTMFTLIGMVHEFKHV